MGRGPRVEFGVNLNNREPLIAPDYDLAALLDLSVAVEELGFSSVWAGDSLFSKPRHDPLALLSAVSQRTSRVRMGTACLGSALRHPLRLSVDWATVDHLSAGRTIFGACMGGRQEGVRRDYAALGLPFEDRATLFEEGLEVLRSIWTKGEVDFHGTYFDFDRLTCFSGTEMEPLMPIQRPPPMWIVSNPRLLADMRGERAHRTMRRACRRIVRLGDGWLTCCRARHPEDLTEQLGYLDEEARALGRSSADYTVAYQVTLNIGNSAAEARAALDDYITKYYPELSRQVDLSNWGPVGTPDEICAWFREFSARGVDHFVCRFGSLDQFGQVERFATEVLPAFEAQRVA